jgi:hypothetical protein
MFTEEKLTRERKERLDELIAKAESWTGDDLISYYSKKVEVAQIIKKAYILGYNDCVDELIHTSDLG